MEISAIQIEGHLAKEDVAPLYILCGEDESLAADSLSALKRRNESDDRPGGMAVEFDDVADHRRIFDELYTRPFLGMAGKRMVVVRCGEELADAAPEQLTDYAKRPSSTSVLVLCCRKLDRRSNPGRALFQHGVWVVCGRVSWQDARKWLGAEVGKYGKRLGGGVAKTLLDAVGPDVTALKGEVEKLVLYTGDRKVIDQRAVDDIVPASRARTVFELSDSIVSSRPREAVALSETLLLHGEAPEMIIAFLGTRMRDLWQVARLARRRMPANKIAGEVGMPEFAVKRALGSVRKRNDRWFAGRLKILADADVELKTSSLPARQRSTWLIGLVSELCA